MHTHHPTGRPSTPAEHRRARAFTLIELIVVVIIIAVLAAIAGTAYNTYVSDARDTAVLATAKQVDKAITAKSARDDVNPTDLVAAAFADPNGFETHLSVHDDDTTYGADNETTPTQVEVAMGSRAACLTLGDAAGEASTVTLGACGDVVAAPDGGRGGTGGGAEPVATTVATGGLDGVRFYDHVVGDDGSVVFVGTLVRAVTFGEHVVDTSGGFDVVVAKMSPTGEWLWATTGGGETGHDYGHGIAVDAAGNVYVTGQFSFTAKFGDTSLPSTGESDAFVAMLAPTGQWGWALKAGSSSHDRAHGVVADASGNLYVTGEFKYTATFTDTISVTANGLSDLFVAKVSPTGQWEWAIREGGTGIDAGYGLALAPDGNVVVAGGAPLVFVGKVSAADGSWVWTQSGGGANSAAADVTAAPDGGFVVTGHLYSTTSAPFGDTTLQSSGGTDVMAAKVSADGQWLWAAGGGGVGTDNGKSVAVDEAGSVYLTGVFTDAATVGGIDLVSEGRADVLVAKLSATGDWLWVKSGGGLDDEYAGGIGTDPAGGVIVSGRFMDWATFGDTTLDSAYAYAGFVTRWNSDGTTS